LLFRLPVTFLFDVGGCMPDLSWQGLYKAALAENDPIKLTGCIEAAQHAIRNRLEEMDRSGDEVSRERQQLDQALHALFTLRARKRSA
jgi:hypothetical protein